jgi:hypothetical protein
LVVENTVPPATLLVCVKLIACEAVVLIVVAAVAEIATPLIAAEAPKYRREPLANTVPEEPTLRQVITHSNSKGWFVRLVGSVTADGVTATVVPPRESVSKLVPGVPVVV